MSKKTIVANRSEAWKFAEGDVAEVLGIPREAVRELRSKHLYENEDYGVVGREIRYSQDGIRGLAAVLKKNAPDGVRAGDLAPAIHPAAGPAADSARVARIYPTNPQYLEAVMGGKTVTVKVRDNFHFLPGMILPAGNLARRNERLFDFCGRLPRARGRW